MHVLYWAQIIDVTIHKVHHGPIPSQSIRRLHSNTTKLSVKSHIVTQKNRFEVVALVEVYTMYSCVNQTVVFCIVHMHAERRCMHDPEKYSHVHETIYNVCVQSHMNTSSTNLLIGWLFHYYCFQSAYFCMCQL